MNARAFRILEEELRDASMALTGTLCELIKVMATTQSDASAWPNHATGSMEPSPSGV